MDWRSDISAQYQSLEVSNLEIARQYLNAIKTGADREVLAGFFDPVAIERDYPNRFSPLGMSRWLSSILENAEQTRTTFTSQRYTITHEAMAANSVILEVLWEGTLATSWQAIAPGSTIRSHIAMVLEFRNGKIIEQRNYSCFDPFPSEQTQG